MLIQLRLTPGLQPIPGANEIVDGYTKHRKANRQRATTIHTYLDSAISLTLDFPECVESVAHFRPYCIKHEVQLF